MKVDNQILIQKYYEEISKKYPHLTFDEVKLICVTPFTYTRQEMESGNLRTIRLKYLGTFLVYPKRVQSLLATMITAFKELRIDAKVYFKKKAMMEKYLEYAKEKENK